MKLSIVIVSWKVKDLLKECLTSIYEQTRKYDFEVFVVDNDSGDGTVEMVKQDFPEVKLIANDFNAGFAKANNQAIKQSKGDYVLLLNPDTQILDSALDKMVEYMDARPDCGMSSCKLLNSDMSLQPSVRAFPRLLDQSLILLKIHHFLPNLKCFKRYLAKGFDYDVEQSVDQIMGAFMFIRREVIDKIGMLDEDFWIWFEEVDFCHRAKDAGYKICYYPKAQIVHHFGQSFKQKFSLEKQKIFNASMRHYFCKHHSKFAGVVLIILHPISLALAWLSQLIKKK